MEQVLFETLFEIPLRNGVTKPKKVRGEGYKMVNMGELFSYPIIDNIPMDRVPLTSLEEKNSLLKKGDLLFARQSLVRSGAGQCSIFMNDNEKICFESHLIRCRLDRNKANPLFYFYFFRSYLGRNIIDTIIEQGAGASGIRGSDLCKLNIPYINLQKQNDIANKLFSLDQKITLNTQTNQTLEQIAQAIFKHWFIDFAPVRAKANALASGASPEQAELATMASLSGKTLAEITALQHTTPEAYHQLQQTARAFPSEFVESEMGLVPRGWEAGTIGTISTSRREKVKNENAIVLSAISSGELIRSEEYFSKQVYSKNIEKYLKVYPLDFAYNPSRINIGSIGLHKENFIGAVSPVYEVFTPKEHYHWFLELIINTNYIKDSIKILSSGSVRQSLKLYEFQSIKIIIPPSNLIKIFNNTLILLNQVIDKNKNENSILEKIRDELLPKLLNGEIEL